MPPAAPRTRADLEAEIGQIVSQFEQEFTGRGPVRVRAYLREDVILVRLEGALTVIEQNLALRPGRGPTLVKQLRHELMMSKRQSLAEQIQGLLGVKVRGVYFDVNTDTGEGLVVWTLEQGPILVESGESRNRRSSNGAR